MTYRRGGTPPQPDSSRRISLQHKPSATFPTRGGRYHVLPRTTGSASACSLSSCGRGLGVLLVSPWLSTLDTQLSTFPGPNPAPSTQLETVETRAPLLGRGFTRDCPACAIGRIIGPIKDFGSSHSTRKSCPTRPCRICRTQRADSRGRWTVRVIPLRVHIKCETLRPQSSASCRVANWEVLVRGEWRTCDRRRRDYFAELAGISAC